MDQQKKSPGQTSELATGATPETTPQLTEKELDQVTGGKASPVLMQACATGVHLKEATITH